MATLVPPGKLKRTYWVGPDGRKVTADTPGAVKKEWTNSKYYIQYRVGRKQKLVPAYRDKRASEKRMDALVQAAERGQEGLVDPFRDHGYRKAVEHLEEYLPVHRQRVTNDKYFEETERILRRVFSECRVTALEDLTADRVETYLTRLRRSPNTRKKHHSAISGFVKWLFKRGRVRENLMLRVEVPRGSVQKEYRSLSVEEIKKLLDVTAARPLREALMVRRGPRKGQLVAKVKPEVRARLEQEGLGRRLLYQTAVLTGLRKEELERLKVGYIDFDAQPLPRLDVPTEATKAKRKAVIWLVSSLAQELRKWAQATGRGPDDELFIVPDKLTRIFRRDLKMADIPLETPKGRARFRSLRKSSNVALRGLGFDVKARQLFMRHSDIRLTADTYDDGTLEDLAHMAAEMEKLGLNGSEQGGYPSGPPEESGHAEGAEASASADGRAVAPPC